MNRQRHLDPNEVRVLVAIARRFYVDGASKVELASEFGVSRFKVARLLDQARSEGVVNVTIEHPYGGDAVLASDVAEHLGVGEVYLATASPDVVREREALGATAAKYLTSSASRGDRIGFSWGRTLLPMVQHLGELPDVEIVQISGMVGNDPRLSPIEMFAQLSSNRRFTTKALFAPLFSTTPSSAESARHEPAVADILGRLQELDFVFLSVGSWNPPISQLIDHLSQDDIRELNNEGAVAEVAGMFFDDDGNYLDVPLNDRRISMSLQELRSARHVVAVAGQAGKTRAIRSVCASGVIDCLITTDEVASMLLDTTPVPHRR
ncbi:sugar-binding transcriptional regulator [Actinomyces ruminis]|uniref:sugar-binding transcriptional regulator n=1 Tax=Actinomyces ruminis TaxID=1937003 RepID=UPI0015D50FA5|nr:sugar-binding domain-containing protein [Actinomyces ruminis]